MYHCLICCSTTLAVPLEQCFECLQAACTDCLTLNSGTCPWCLEPVSEQAAIARETLRLTATLMLSRKEISAAASAARQCSDDDDSPTAKFIREMTRQCPSCSARTERPPADDCSQILCPLCGTTWSWMTLVVVKDSSEFHNPMHFKIATRPKLRDTNADIDSAARVAYKCLKTLDREEHMFASDSKTYRQAMVNGVLTTPEFNALVVARFRSHRRNIIVRRALDKMYSNLTLTAIAQCSRELEREGLCLKNLPYV